MAKGNNTKAKIARVAWKLFHEKGYEETTIDEIILQSGTSKEASIIIIVERMSFWHLSQRSLMQSMKR